MLIADGSLRKGSTTMQSAVMRTRRYRLSTGRVDKRPHPLELPQFAIEIRSLFGLRDVCRDILLFEHPVRLWRDAEAFVETSGEDDYGGAALQQSLHVSRSYAGIVAGTGLAPVPLFGATREEPGVLECAFLRLPAAPGEVGYPWRVRATVHATLLYWSSRKPKSSLWNSSGFSTCGVCPQSGITSSR